MAKHEEICCPICNKIFTCKKNDITNCQCNTVKLTEETVNFLAETNLSCLCKECLNNNNLVNFRFSLLTVPRNVHEGDISS